MMPSAADPVFGNDLLVRDMDGAQVRAEKGDTRRDCLTSIKPGLGNDTGCILAPTPLAFANVYPCRLIYARA